MQVALRDFFEGLIFRLILFIKFLLEEVDDHLYQEESLVNYHLPEIARKHLDAINHEERIL